MDNNKSRSNETRFEHIAKVYHELKVSDIESIKEGIANYITFYKSVDLKDTYYYIIKRKGKWKGMIQVAIKLYENELHKAYVKTIFITYRVKK